MAKKKTTQPTPAPQDPYALALGLLEESRVDHTKTEKAARQLASLMSDAPHEVRKVLHESCSALLAGQHDKAEFHLTNLMRVK